MISGVIGLGPRELKMAIDGADSFVEKTGNGVLGLPGGTDPGRFRSVGRDRAGGRYEWSEQ